MSTGNELAGDLSLSRSSSLTFKSLDDILSADDLTEDDVLAVQPGAGNGGDEELRSVGVLASVSHGQEVGLVVSVEEVLVSKLFAVDGLATSAVVVGEVTSLDHEVRDDSVEDSSSVAETLLASAESAEVLSSLGDLVRVQLEGDSLGLTVVDRDVEVDLGHFS